MPPKPLVRRRECGTCGKVEMVRKDNSAARCRSCSNRENQSFAPPPPNKRTPCAKCGKPCRHLYTYCSRACRKAAVTVERCCVKCGNSFSIRQSALSGKTNSSGRFCSRPCYEAWLCRTGRVTGRGSQWKRARQEALRRNPFCAICGQLRRLEVHHIIPFRISWDNRQVNLIPLCKKHHKIVETAFLGTEEFYDAGVSLLLWRGILMERQDATRMMLMEIICEKAA